LDEVAKCGSTVDDKIVKDLLVKLEIVSNEEVSTDSYICKLCLVFLTNATKAWTIANVNVEMLKERRAAREQGSVGKGVHVSQGNGKNPSGQ
jgi:hypothetical protein